jgi:DNA-binding NarL/FixJ family response regulator
MRRLGRGPRELGAGPATAIAARRLRERGVRAVPRGPRRLRNAQIAKRLVLSEKTVDHHVSAILRKLDAETRGEAAAAAAGLGLTHPS